MGLILSVVSLSLAQKRDNIFYESPQLALSLLLGVVYLLHLFHSLVILNYLFSLCTIDYIYNQQQNDSVNQPQQHQQVQ